VSKNEEMRTKEYCTTNSAIPRVDICGHGGDNELQIEHHKYNITLDLSCTQSMCLSVSGSLITWMAALWWRRVGPTTPHHPTSIVATTAAG
jgi:hypothetical protein